MKGSPATRPPGIGRALRPPAVKVREASGSTLLQTELALREPIRSKRRSAPLSASGVALWGEERYLRACLIQHWMRYHRRAGNEVLARRLNRCMHSQTNEEQVRRLRASLPELSASRLAPQKAPKQ